MIRKPQAALVALVVLILATQTNVPASNAQEFTEPSAPLHATGRFVQLSRAASRVPQSMDGVAIQRIAIVESADATSYGELGVHPPAPASVPGHPSLLHFSEQPMHVHEVAAGVDQKVGCDLCQADCKAKCCCPPVWAHRTGVFGEFLYLRPRDSEVAYALPVDGDVPIGPVALVDQDYSPGFRVGFQVALDECTSLVATYSQLDSSTSDLVDSGPTPALRGLLLHPATLNAATDFLTASANYDLDFRIVDADYRSVLFAGDGYAVNYSLGARYAHLDQDLAVVYTNAGTTETVVTDIDFDGAGLRLGLDAERHSLRRGLMAYGKAFASFAAGEFRADYDHRSTIDPNVVDTAWTAGRVVTMLDLELGVGWQSPCGHFRVTGGYIMSTWLNTVNTDEWVAEVQSNSFVGLNDRMSFDGFTARAEYGF